MALEQELASIIKFVLDGTGNPAPYYYKVPQSFSVPAAYFPRPEIVSGADTFNFYSLEYAWYIKLFAQSDEAAYDLGLTALTAIRGKRNLIPLIDEDGEEVSGSYVRVNDPSIKMLDDGACQLAVVWISRRPYDTEDSEKMMTYELTGWKHPDIYLSREISVAMETAIESYLTDYTTEAEYAGEYPDTE